jgi:hypothetical protein
MAHLVSRRKISVLSEDLVFGAGRVVQWMIIAPGAGLVF